MTKEEKVEEILTRGAAEVIHLEVLREKLLSGKKLRIKFGIDPTSPNIHIGRATTLWKLRELQDLGHTIIFIIGDFTAVIGDTSDKESERPMLTREEVERNMATYFEQAGKILDMNKVEKHYNSEWLEKLTYREIGEHADTFSVSDFISRDNIKRRLDQGKRVSLREVLYPLMQGYDSVAVKADVEIGGTDQKFNILAGRTLQTHFKQEPQNIILLDLIEGLDGRKMSSSWGNTISLTDPAKDMFIKVMRLRDEFIVKYFIHATRVPISVANEAQAALERGENPRDVKLSLAEEIVSMYFSKEEAARAREATVFLLKKRGVPDDVLEIKFEKKLLMDIFVQQKIVSSKSEWRRLVKEGAVVRFNREGAEEKITDELEVAQLGDAYKIGRRGYTKLI
ncbi:MAG: tyrosine--tRNA ligase [bacterium]|nr:tyrosine--tRNA ligase [bacterium]